MPRSSPSMSYTESLISICCPWEEMTYLVHSERWGGGMESFGFLLLYNVLQRGFSLHTEAYIHSKARFTICRLAPSRPAAEIEMDSILATRQRGTARRGKATYCEPSQAHRPSISSHCDGVMNTTNTLSFHEH